MADEFAKNMAEGFEKLIAEVKKLIAAIADFGGEK